MELIFDLHLPRRCRVSITSVVLTQQRRIMRAGDQSRGNVPDVPPVNPVTFKHIT